MTTLQIYEWALRLPPNERLALARQLLASLDADVLDAALATEWTAEAESRAAAYEAGELEADDWEESLQRTREAIAKDRF